MYSYTEKNRFLEKNSYMYTPFKGYNFLTEFLLNREKALSYITSRIEGKATQGLSDLCQHQTDMELEEISQIFLKGKSFLRAEKKLENYIRRFEVAKRLRNNYPVTDLNDLASTRTHILFFGVLILAFDKTEDIRYINVILINFRFKKYYFIIFII